MRVRLPILRRRRSRRARIGARGATVQGVYGLAGTASRRTCASWSLMTLTTGAPLRHLVLTGRQCESGDEDRYALVRRVRQQRAERGGFLPAITLTGYAGVDGRTRALPTGFQTHVAKR